jgi:hypothetical protein
VEFGFERRVKETCAFSRDMGETREKDDEARMTNERATRRTTDTPTKRSPVEPYL